MAKRVKASASVVELAFFKYLWGFYAARRKSIRSRYNELTRRFLDFNDPEKNPTAYLRRPQFEALEIYVYLKERLDNAPVYAIFERWYNKQAPFEDRDAIGLSTDTQLAFVDQFDESAYRKTFDQMRSAGEGGDYSNFIFALTMGTGKTILMATCIFYEFLLANKYPTDKRYAHNALVFAPDRTVLQSLREIQTFDRARLVPPDYVNVLNGLLTFHFLEDVGTTLNVLAGSRFNLIISNTQKIILKRQAKQRSASEMLFKTGKPGYKQSQAFSEASELYDFDTLEDTELSTNQRFDKLRRLEQIGVYIDEAHHAFGKQLERDLSRKAASETSLRRTVDELALELKKAGTSVVACFNFTGTPYANGLIFPEVVYAFGLKEAIDCSYLKRVRFTGYLNPKSDEFVTEVLTDFFERHPEGTVFEGLKPKIAFFASGIEELTDELRPAVEAALAKLGRSSSIINVNVGDESVTSNDDRREFERLDSPASDKQVVLLVNKGKEGWNCRSLFGVALYRQPKSKVFVLQATMRCLRSIAAPPQRTGHIYLSSENLQILEDELNQNFKVGLAEIREAGDQKPTHEAKPVPPPRTIKVKRIRQLWQMGNLEPGPGVPFDFDELDMDRYRLVKVEQEGLTFNDAARAHRVETDLTSHRARRVFSAMTLSAEIARYLNRSPLQIEYVVRNSREGMEEVLRRVNEFNELLYDRVIPRLFHAFYEVEPFTKEKEEEVLLVREPEDGAYRVQAHAKDVVRMDDAQVAAHAGKSFHLSLYCFDSKPERKLFLDLLPDLRVQSIYFTGMLTHGQSDFFIEYIDPESHSVRRYYPDFLVFTEDEGWIIVEVKRDDQIEDPVVQAKADATRQMASASRMTYRIIPATAVMNGHAASVLHPSTGGPLALLS